MFPWRRHDPAAPPKAGDVLAGKYRVEKVLGVGGMGVVVAARHAKLGELVALKVLRSSVLKGQDDVARFFREGKAASKLKSEHVVRILDLGELPGGAPFLVMEHLEGRDLAAILAEHGPLAITHAVETVLEACEAIAEAHALGIVHRDLKPANLFLARQPGGSSIVKVLDFGISKLTRPDQSEPDLSLTATRTLMGSPMYMAPEFMRSARAADARSDVWAIGVMLYELLTGTTPFHAETVTELAIKVLEETPRPPSRFRDEIPPELDDVVLKCLARDPNQRFASAFEVAAALAPIDGARGIQKLDRIVRVVHAAEQRARTQLEAGTNPGTTTGGQELDLAETTLRGWGTTQFGAGARRTRAIVIAAVGAAVLSAAGVVVWLGLHGDAQHTTAARTSGESSASGASESKASPSSETSAPVASAAPAPPASSAPTVKPEKPPVAAPTHAPTVAPKAGGKKPKAGQAGGASPYFDDPN